jgi:DNA processing protein
VTPTTPPVRCLSRGEPGYPPRLLELRAPPPVIHLAGEMGEAPVIAVVGTRKPSADADAFARELAGTLVAHGAVVVSGGAVGIDAAAHTGALDAGGVTWVVAATGPEEVFPKEHAPLFERVLSRRGVMVWPFASCRKAHLSTFRTRNGVLAALADALVIVQAGAPSGTLNAAAWARRLGRPVWAVCAPPWTPGYNGCASAIERGARPLVSVASFIRAVGLLPPVQKSVPHVPRDEVEAALLALLSSTEGKHLDEIAARSGLSVPVVATALLTLALENVVVEGPEGFFSRAAVR